MATLKEVLLPDIGDFKDVEVIEVLVQPGDRVEAEASLITLESEKATMEIPSPYAGTVRELFVHVGDKVSEGTRICAMEVEDAESAKAAPAAPPPPSKPTADREIALEASEEPEPKSAPAPEARAERPAPPPPAPPAAKAPGTEGPAPHASPSVRRFARELGVDLHQVRGTGRKGRIVKEDVQGFVKDRLARPAAAATPGAAELPAIDFSQFGEVEERELHKIRKVSARNLHRNWTAIPHVTQFDEADITALEEFRKAQSDHAAKRGVKLTLLAFVVKAVAYALKEFPEFNSSLAPDGERLILKKYFHVAFAVDTPNGLVVPVLRDVNRKGLFAIAGELGEVAERARARKLRPEDMQGACFTISSLGGVGGTAFTPIINWPEVAILGVSRGSMRPVWQEEAGEFAPRLILPLSLSYDHRVIDGAAAARFTTMLRTLLSDVRNLLL